MRNKLSKLRERANVDAKYVYENIKVTNDIYSKWENNKRKVPLKYIIDICNLFEIKLDYLLNLSDNIEISKIKYSSDKKKIGNKLKEIRTDLSMSLREESKLTDISFNALSRYERGIRLISTSALTKISIKTGYDVNWILSEKETTKNKITQNNG